MRRATIDLPDRFFAEGEGAGAWSYLLTRFGCAVADKAAEVLTDDDSLRFSTTCIRKNPRVQRLAKLCEGFMKQFGDYVTRTSPGGDQRGSDVRQETERMGKQFQKWLVDAIQGKEGLGSI